MANGHDDTREWKAVGAKANALHSLIIVAGLVVGAIIYFNNDHLRAQGAVQREEFQQVNSRQDQALADSMHNVRLDVSRNTANIDSALAKVTKIIEDGNRQQLLALCQYAAEAAQHQPGPISICSDVRHVR